MNVANLTVKEFLDDLASGSPAPGGGSVAALAGAVAAALAGMVARLTLGREKFRDAWPAMEAAADEADRLRTRFLGLADEDADAYLAVASARKLPKAGDDELAARTRALACATLRAARVPLETLLLAGHAAALAGRVLERGNPSCVTDAGAAVRSALLAAETAAYNVTVNLSGIADAAERTRLARETDAALAAVHGEAARLSALVGARLEAAWKP